MYQITLKKQAKKDLKKIKSSNLINRFDEILNSLKENPYQPNQSMEKLTPPVKGFYSRRLNIQHRLVYQVDQEHKKVIIWSAWAHYG